VRKLPAFPQSLIAGALAALITSLLIWACTVSGIFTVLGIPVAAPPDVLPWMAKRVLYAALAGLLFLIPVLTKQTQWIRGLIASVVPMLVILLVLYPGGREGWLGLNLGVPLPITVIVTWAVWGAIAGWLLTRWGFMGAPTDQDEIYE